MGLPKFVTDPNPEIYLHGKFVCLDFETYGTDYGDAGNPQSGIVLASWAQGENLGRGVETKAASVSPRVEWGDEYAFGELRDAVRGADFIIAHHAKYELKWLHRMGLDLRKILPYCTQIGEYVGGGNRRRPLDLDSTARRYGVAGKLGFVSSLIKAGVDVRDIPEQSLRDYCARDVEATLRVAARQVVQLNAEGLLPVTYARNLVTPALAAMEFEGMQVDAERTATALRGIQLEYRGASDEVDTLTGGINFRSPKQLGTFLYETLGFAPAKDWRGNPVVTESGKPSTSIKTLEVLEAKTPKQRAFKKAMKVLAPLKKKIQTLEQLKACVDDPQYNGLLFAAFHQTVTSTHRLSSSGGKFKLQFHNFPRAFKPLFRARRDGWILCEADAPQLEFRVGVDLGRDRVGLADILRRVDVHEFTADTMGLERTPAKAFTFKPLYGGTSGTPRERAYYEAFRAKYAGIYGTQSGWVYCVLKDKKLRIPSGLIFYWPDTELTKSGYITNTPSIFNYPVQSFATADIIPLTLVLVWHKVRDLQVALSNTIHDSIIAEVHPDAVEDYKQVLIDSFTKDIYWLIERLYNYKFIVPLGVGVKTGTFWGEGDEEKYEGHGTADFGKELEWKGSVLGTG